MMRNLLLLACAALVTGCTDPIRPTHVPCNPLLLTFGPQSGEFTTTPEGVRYLDLKIGSGGVARVGSSLFVNYSLYDTAGSGIESSCAVGRTVFNTIIGSGRAIPGFELGIIGMQPGGVRRVLIPSHLAYGEGDLIFDIELVEIL